MKKVPLMFAAAAFSGLALFLVHPQLADNYFTSLALLRATVAETSSKCTVLNAKSTAFIALEYEKNILSKTFSAYHDNEYIIYIISLGNYFIIPYIILI